MRTWTNIAFILAACFLVLQGCRSDNARKTNWSVVLDRASKDPYGTWIAWESLPNYFPHARIEQLSRRFRYTSIDNNMQYHGDSTALLVMVGLDYYLSDEEWNRLKNFVHAGNEVCIFSSTLDQKIGHDLHCEESGGAEEYPLSKYNDGNKNMHVLRLSADSLKYYGHKGRSLAGYFAVDEKDSTIEVPVGTTDNNNNTIVDVPTGDDNGNIHIRPAEILGRFKSAPNFIRYRYGDGHITLHAAPLTLSNYFLLQKDNRKYLDGIWHAFPATISHIYWNEYYKRTTEGSDMGVLWRYPATRWAMILAIATLIIYVLFGIKRRQRIVPVIRPVENASVSFVETVGRLYYNKGNHANLAEKMVQHFLEWVRTHYYIDTSLLNDTFIKQLVSKSGKSEAEVSQLVQSIHDLRLGNVPITQEYLYTLHRTLQSYYNNNRN